MAMVRVSQTQNAIFYTVHISYRQLYIVRTAFRRLKKCTIKKFFFRPIRALGRFFFEYLRYWRGFFFHITPSERAGKMLSDRAEIIRISGGQQYQKSKKLFFRV